jgi:iron complex outermembrane receptor protein
LENVQQLIDVPFGDIPSVAAIINGKSASGPGFDFGVTTRPVAGLELRVSFSANDLTEDSEVISAGTVLYAKGDRLSFSPKYTTGGSAAYVFPLTASGYQGRFEASANYTSEQSWRTITAGAVNIGAGTPMLIARTGFSILAPKHWETTIFADNINNERGSYYANPIAFTPDPDSAMRVRPRTIGLQFDYKCR